MQISIKSLVAPSIPQIVLLTICCAGIWGLSLFETPHLASGNNGSLLSGGIQTYTESHSLLSQFFILAIVIFNAFLVSQLNTRFTIIRTRTFLPVLFFLLLSATWFEKRHLNESHLLLTISNLSFFYFLRMVRNRNSSEEAFMGSLMLSCGSLLINPFVLLIPICWIGFMIFQSLSFRTFLASVLGTLAPWILYLTALLATNGIIDFENTLNLKPSFDIKEIQASMPILIYAGGLLIMMCIGLIGLSSLTISDSIQTKNKLNFLILLFFSIIILALLFREQTYAFLPLLGLCFSILFAHPLTLKLNNFYAILFITFVVWNVGFVLYKLIIH